jgi:hypothetical protein
MNLTDELERLSKLHQDGSLCDEEFAQAKSKLLNQPAEIEPAEKRDKSLGDAANRFVSFQIVMGLIGIIILLIILFGVILPHMHNSHSFQIQFPGR